MKKKKINDNTLDKIKNRIMIVNLHDENLECSIYEGGDKIHFEFEKEGFMGYEFVDQYHLTPTRLLEVLQFLSDMHDEKDLKLLDKVKDYSEDEI